MVLKSANFTNRFRISGRTSSSIRYMHKTDIRNHYVMRSVLIEAFPWRHLRIFTIVQTKEES